MRVGSFIKREKGGRRSARGVALMAVIWLVALLSFATVAALRVVAFDLDVAQGGIHGFRAAQLAEMGIAIGVNPAVERADPLLMQWSEEEAEGFLVKLTSEGGRFNINAILAREDKNLLKSIFTDWGMELEEAEVVVDSLVDWVDANDEPSMHGAELDWYEALGRINQPFNRPFYSLDEMRLVRGMDLVEAIKPDWRDWFTVWSSGPLDLNEAAAELIAAAAEVSVEAAGAIPDRVYGPDGILGTEDDIPFQSRDEALALLGLDGNFRPDIVSRFGVNDTVTRVESIGVAEGARRRINVIVRNRTGQPAILERTEEILP